ncbi:MAG: hypothetical protein ACK50A_12915 [Sphingobacteriaceae bacterium]
MNSDKLYSLLTDRSLLANGNLAELEQLTAQFPYFQTAHVLYSMASKKNDAGLFQRSIKKAAIVAVSRKQLYNLLYHEPVSAITEVEKVVEPKIEQPEIVTKAEETKTIVEPTIQKPELLKQVEEIVEIKEPENIIEKVEEQKQLDLQEQVEREIQKDIIEAFVEKEILKTNEAHIKEEPVPQDASFGQWLHFLKKNNGIPLNEIEVKDKTVEQKKESVKTEEIEETEIKNKKEQRKELIDKIIELNPGSIKLKQDTKFFAADQKAKESLQENEHLVTETLAKIYALQGNTSKAIRAYQILSLKYPNKSVYFASLIENLKKGN